ncbi:hypothetical protein Taro_013550, partial [Colocasia esculenta]|nr:hypothetical protein [Colocasia esculenta]
MAFSLVFDLPLLGLLPVLPTSVAVLFFVILLSTVLLLRLGGGSSSSSSPPSPPRIPIIGNLHQLGSLPHHSLAALSREYGPLMLLQLGRVPTLVVSSKEMAEEVLKTQDLVFASRPHSKAAAGIVHGGRPIAFSPYGEYWRQARKIAVVHLLNSHRVQELRPAREAEVARLVRKISELSSSPGSVVDVSRVLSLSTCSFFCSAALGMSGMEEGATREITELVSRGSAVIGGFQVETFFPGLAWLGKFTGMDARLAELARRWRAVLNRVLEEAASRRKRGAEERGFLDVLLALGMDDAAAATGVVPSADVMKGILQTMISAGTDTTRLTLEGALEELVKNPAAMNKAQEEVRAAVQGRPMVAEDDVSRMSYLKAVIKETLRLHPPVPLLIPRESMKATQIQGYEIPAKTRVIINAWAIARNPDYWSSPEQFRPERFLQSCIDFRGSDFQFIPFGAGRRICPGINLANATVEMALANLLYHFDWSLPEAMSVANLDLGEERGLTTHKKQSLLLVPASIAVLFFFILLSTVLLRRLSGGSSSSSPPSPPRIPIIGNLHQLGSLPHQSLAALSREYGPLMLLQLGRVPTLVVSSKEMAEEVLKAQDLVFASRPHSKTVAGIVPGGRPLAFAPYGEYWRQARKIAVVHLLSSHRVQELRPAREAEVARLVRKISELSSSPGSAVDVSRTLSSFTCSFIFRAALGMSGMEEGATREITELVAQSSAVVGGFQVETFFPGLAWLGKFTGMDARLAKLAGRWRAVHDMALREAASRRGCRAEERGFLDVLLALGMDDDAAAAAAAGLALDSDGMKTILQETLRLHPPVPLLIPRESMKATQIQGYEIPAKTRVIINAWAIARNPDYWPSPEQFRPERFLQSRIDFKGSDFEFIPFGAGRRICPGINFANATVELALANLLYHFDWNLPEAMSVANLDLGEERGLTTRKKQSLLLVVSLYSCQ